ncbi:ATP-binding protein [Paenibacillus sp. S-38]|uniref:ATP-binding protein n=1 Tax=Paenibacillus sp. S-38 TaxID=3416710 RepID=UPI003CF47138
MKRITLPPYAPSLFESIRSIGYSLESAIADLIDNSITAVASNINIRFSPNDQPYVGILDDGIGMTSDELTEAMRHGGLRSPTAQRSENDLGRFGLGLKTASLSQCRRLTVASLKNGELSARSWDLDVIIDAEEWIMLELDDDEIMALPLIDDLLHQESGTLVIWQDLDRISSGEATIERALGDKMDTTREHLSLVFHRYINGEPGIKKLRIKLNGNPLEAIDPFLVSHRATEPMPDEIIPVEGHLVKVKPYILPHISKLSNSEKALAGGEEGLRKNQGFYVYRNKRLIIYGTWFRLIKQQELTKLARVKVDIPNTMDHLWTIDIKKSVASPPETVRHSLKRIVERIAEGSRRVYKFRGRKVNDASLIHLWERFRGREGIWYQINREHPLIVSLLNKIGSDEKACLELLLKSIEEFYPFDALYADMASDETIRVDHEDEGTYENLKALANILIQSLESIEGGAEKVINQLIILEPFCNYPDITKRIREELLHG